MKLQLVDFASCLRGTIHSLGTAPSVLADSQFNGLALELFGLQFEHNPAYRNLCEARRLFPGAIRHWKEIPALPVAAFKEFEVTCLRPEERAAVFHSSGTTEPRRSRHFHSVESLSVYETSLWPWFATHVLPGLNQGSRLDGGGDDSIATSPMAILLLTPPPIHAPHSSLVHMLDFVRRKLGGAIGCFVGDADSDGSWTVNLGAALSMLENWASGGRPVILLGTAFSLVQLLDGMAGSGLEMALPPGSRVMETGGYKGRSRELHKTELHRLITMKLGVPDSNIVCEYGMSELSSQAYDHRVNEAPLRSAPEKRAFHFPPWARAQIVCPENGSELEDGETGLLRIFDLANVDSAMALQTEDLAVKRGDGFELIGRARSAEPRGCSLMSAKT